MGGTFAKSGYLDQFEAEGYAVLRRVFTAAEVAEMAAAFDRIWARALAGGRSWRDRNVFFCVAEEPGNGPVLRFAQWRSEEHTSELQSLMRISYAVFCLQKKTNTNRKHT